MSINQFTEDSYEQTLIDLFQRMGYQYECGYDVERDFQSTAALCREITLKDVARIPLLTRLAGWLLKVLAPLM